MHSRDTYPRLPRRPLSGLLVPGLAALLGLTFGAVGVAAAAEPATRTVVQQVPGPERVVEVPGPERVVTKRVEVPGPARVVTKRVEVASPACLEAVEVAERAITAHLKYETDILNAMTDYLRYGSDGGFDPYADHGSDALSGDFQQAMKACENDAGSQL